MTDKEAAELRKEQPRAEKFTHDEKHIQELKQKQTEGKTLTPEEAHRLRELQGATAPEAEKGAHTHQPNR